MTAAVEGSGARTGRGAAAPRVSLRELAWALPRMRRDPLAVWQHYYDAYGPVVCQPALGRFDTYYLFGPDANRLVLLDRDGDLLRDASRGR